MSRSDYPPGYDNSHGPMYPPQGGGYPPPPSYGFPSYGGPQPGQPFAPYPSGPNAPLFPGQPTGYPAAPYPGQPQPAGPPGSGYPAPPPMPPVMPPTIPSGVLSSGKGPFILLLSGRTCKAFDFFEIVHILSTTQSSNVVETVSFKVLKCLKFIKQNRILITGVIYSYILVNVFPPPPRTLKFWVHRNLWLEITTC